MVNCTEEIAERASSQPLSREDTQLIRKIRSIVCKGNDAEVRRKKDGTLTVYEVRKKAI